MSVEQARRRRLGVLLGASLLNWTTGNGLFPLLPLYALERGVAVEGAGMLLAAGFGGLAAGSLLAARLASAIGGPARAYVGAALLQAGGYALLGRATAEWQLVALLSITWLGAGVAGTTAQVLAGSLASAASRGRVFGLLALAPPLGALIGASLLGAVAAHSGYGRALDSGACLVLGAGLLMALGMRARGDAGAEPAAADRPGRGAARAGPAELLLLAAALLGSTALFFGRLATPVLMHALGFDPQAIAATAAVGGLLTAPFVPLVGALSDRLGRRPVLIGTYALVALASVTLGSATQLWQFSLGAALLSLGFAVGGSVSAALAGDLIPAARLPQALGRLGASSWVAAVIAFAGGGALLGRVAAPALCLLAALVATGAGLAAGWVGGGPRPALGGAPAGPAATRRQS